MIKLEDIEKELIASDAPGLPENLIAAGVKFERGYARHAGIIIKYNGTCFIFHYGGTDVLLENVPQGQWYFHKEFVVIDKIFVPSFLIHCRKVLKKARPKYGCFFPGSYYDSDGNHFSESNMPEYMTCVGFCLNVIKGFLRGKDYISYEDWTIDSINSQEYINNFLAELQKSTPHLTENDLKGNIRRILPDEYLTSAYYSSTLPVDKAFVDTNVPNVRTVLLSSVP